MTLFSFIEPNKQFVICLLKSRNLDRFLGSLNAISITPLMDSN